MPAVLGNQGVYEASLAGGLSPEEAEELAELDLSRLENGEYDPSDIPALGAYIEGYQVGGAEVPVPAEEPDGYVKTLLEHPDDVIQEWDIGDYPFENIATNIQEKRDEYTLRTLYTLEDSLDQDMIDEAVRSIAVKPDYRHETAASSADGNLGMLLGQYMNEIHYLVDDEDVIAEVHETVAESPGSSVTAAASKTVNELPETVIEKTYPGGNELDSERITTRLRDMQGAGKCGDLEKGHEEVLLGDQPTRNTSLIYVEGELVGSLKHTGSTSMLGLQDLTFNGKQLLQKGMTYRISHPVLDAIASEKTDARDPKKEEWGELMKSGRMNEEKVQYQDWELKNIDRLELRPLRFAGEIGDYTVEGFRNRIETRRQELEDKLL
ncbi:MAG: hypothetical protein ABEK10_02470 [Candidatus Nanosalina sp.]